MRVFVCVKDYMCIPVFLFVFVCVRPGAYVCACVYVMGYLPFHVVLFLCLYGHIKSFVCFCVYISNSISFSSAQMAMFECISLSIDSDSITHPVWFPQYTLKY